MEQAHSLPIFLRQDKRLSTDDDTRPALAIVLRPKRKTGGERVVETSRPHGGLAEAVQDGVSEHIEGFC